LFQKRIVLCLLPVILLLAFCSLGLHGPAGSNFQGTVLDTSDSPIARASIKLEFDNQTLETNRTAKDTSNSLLILVNAI
jgi:hypothetical protein